MRPLNQGRNTDLNVIEWRCYGSQPEKMYLFSKPPGLSMPLEVGNNRTALAVETIATIFSKAMQFYDKGFIFFFKANEALFEISVN